MRPEILFPLFTSVTSLPGVGPRIAKLLEAVAGANVVDLLWHLPRDVIDRSFSPLSAEAPAGRVATIKVQVDKHQPGHGRRPYRIRCSDESGFLTLIYFHVRWR